MTTLLFDKKQLDHLEITSGLLALQEDYAFTAVFEGMADIAVTIKDAPGDKLSLCFENGNAKFTFDFTRRNHFFRLLGLLLEQIADGKTDCHLEETGYFKRNGPMFDLCQGNAALNMDAMKFFLRKSAIMGLSQILLYMEDTYDVPEEPYFGYMRARYTYEELKEIDDYAHALGMEAVPLIQALAHYRDVLKWNVYREIREDEDCLLPEDEDTYTFLRHVITAAAKPFRTKRISLTMDEAPFVGQGSSLVIHNRIDHKFDIMTRHLKRCLEITDELGLRVMISSDMFFNALCGKQYTTDVVIPQEFIDSMPDVDLLYWNYYSTDNRHRKLIELRQQLSSHIVFQGGIWVWAGFSPNWTMTRAVTDPAMDACKDKGIDDVHATIWGDSGTECDTRMALWGIQYFAEHGFMRDAPSEEHLRRRFRFCTGGDYDLFFAMQNFDQGPGVAQPAIKQQNPTKFLVWQDPLQGLFDKNIEGLDLKSHYQQLADLLDNADFGPYATMFEFYRRLAHLLVYKAELGRDIHAAYKAGDRKAMENLANSIIPETAKWVRALREQHYICWRENNKMLGWDVFDMRYGSLLIRLETAAQTLKDYLAGKLTKIEELEEKQLPFNGENGIPRWTNFYGRIVSSGRIAPEDALLRPKKTLRAIEKRQGK